MSLNFTVDRHAVLDSTNLEAMRQARAGAREGLVVIADSQSAGRGRHGKAWQSPPGNLFCSLLLRPAIAPARMGELAFVSALAAADTIDGAIGQGRAALKWPNDVLVDNNKICGNLIETDSTDCVIVGIGINIVSAPDNTPYPTTCLAAKGATTSCDQIADALLMAFSTRYEQWLTSGFAAIRTEWLAHAWNLGAAVVIDADSTNLTGQFDGIDADGALLLGTHTGTRRIVSGSLSYRQSA